MLYSNSADTLKGLEEKSWRGGHTKFYTGMLGLKVQTLSLLYTIFEFLIEKVLLLYTFHKKVVPLSLDLIEVARLIPRTFRPLNTDTEGARFKIKLWQLGTSSSAF